MIKSKRGFTLIELVVVMAIIAILALLIIGAIIIARNTATETTNRSNGQTLRTALESYYARYGKYCGAGGANTCAVRDFTAEATALATDGFNVTLQTTASNTGGGTFTSLTATGATYTPYTYNNQPLPAVSLP